jgi:hypothetical protein
MSPQISSVTALIVGVAISGAGLIAVTPVSPSVPNVHRAVQLVDVDTADSLLGDGTALVFGPSGVPTPPPQYVDAAEQLYLQPDGFTGTAQSSYIPDQFYPFTGPTSLAPVTSLGQDQSIMISDIENQITAGGVSPENPVVVFGFAKYRCRFADHVGARPTRRAK